MPRLATRRSRDSTTHAVGLVSPRPRQTSARRGTGAARADAIHEQIAKRAYEIYLARGDGDGDALGDWLSAERELRRAAWIAGETGPHRIPDGE
jgi:hypothetical protein